MEDDMRGKYMYSLIIIVFILVVVGCTNKVKKTYKEIQKKVVVNLRRDPNDLSSIFADNDEAAVIVGHIFEGLIRLDKNQNVQPGVAKSWYISDDKLTYTFYLRNSSWSDGSQITAMDFEFGLKEVLNPIFRWGIYNTLTYNEKITLQFINYNYPKFYYGY